MNADVILQELNQGHTDYILIGGMNFLLRHRPVLTYDIDVWVENTTSNLERLNVALGQLKAEWGPTEETWRGVPTEASWLQRQSIYCLTTPYGSLDIFREVCGLEGQYDRCKQDAKTIVTGEGVACLGLSDRDMLACQMALPEHLRHQERVAYLQTLIDSVPPSLTRPSRPGQSRSEGRGHDRL